MIYTVQTKKAMKLMFNAHKDQLDKAGIPYVFHPWHVAESMIDEDSTCVALLHDVIEDTDITLDDIKKEGFNESVIQALSCLTHDRKIEYSDYIIKISKNDIATRVKISDLLHNLDLSRLDYVDETVKSRIEKYNKSLKFLQANKKESKNE